MLPKYFRHIIGKILLPNNLLKSRFINSSIDMSVHTGGSPNISKLLLGSNENFENFLNFLANDNFPKEEKYLSQLYTNMKFDLSIYLQISYCLLSINYQWLILLRQESHFWIMI